MSKIINGGSGTFSSSVAGLLVYLELACALQAPGIVQPKEGKVILGADVSFPRGDGKLFVLTQCWSLPRFNASAHLRIFLERYRGSSLSKHCTFKVDIYKMIKS